ncbi:MAG TPA: glycosyltransferase, partial [Rhizobacter sp.]|nr:glycosyltransferase [Rhizobacter sp.]
ALALLAQEKGVAAAVTLLPNPDNAAIRAAMGEASYSVCLSRHEGFGLAAIEAMSAGLVPVLSAIPPFERLAAESGVPLIVPEAALEAATLVMQRHHALQFRHAAVRAQAQRAAQPYSWREVVGAYVEEYERALHPARPAEKVAA